MTSQKLIKNLENELNDYKESNLDLKLEVQDYKKQLETALCDLQSLRLENSKLLQDKLDSDAQMSVKLEEEKNRTRSRSFASPTSPTSPSTFEPLDVNNLTLDIEKELGQDSSEDIKREIMDMKEKLVQFRREVRKISTHQIGEISNYKSPPEAVSKTVRAVGLILDYPESSLRAWDGCRKILRDNFSRRIYQYDPTVKQEDLKFKLVRKELEDVDYNICCQKGSLPTGVMYNFCNTSLQLRERAIMLRRMNHEDRLQKVKEDYDEQARIMLKNC
ncbi:hypothetical protein AKO1_004477 [Acrasis kona]|uniref:Uncharacterized protein n=1 Tax=Acrasis kona TaxID=1008807 RepID=A0AAW2YHR5_9EUKA